MLTLSHSGSVLPPLSWYGGKTLLIDYILRLFPPHLTYVEPFGGSGALLFAKRPAKWEIYNDLHAGLANFLRVIQIPAQMNRLCALLNMTPNSRREHDMYRKDDVHPDPVEWARRTFLLTRQSFSSIYAHSWGYSILSSGNSFHSAIKLIPPASNRLQNVTIENGSAFEMFDKYDTPTTLWYLDPPYAKESRKSKSVYKYELEDEAQYRLMDEIKFLTGMVVLSGYPNSIYAKELRGWKTITKTVLCYSSTSAGSRKGAKKPERTEVLWFNPAAYEALRVSKRWPAEPDLHAHTIAAN